MDKEELIVNTEYLHSLSISDIYYLVDLLGESYHLTKRPGYAPESEMEYMERRNILKNELHLRLRKLFPK